MNVEFDDSDDANYMIVANMNTKLSNEIGFDDTTGSSDNLDNLIHYDPPKEPGLSNSNMIIPSYYKLYQTPHKIRNVDYYAIIKDDIRNFRPLNEYQLEYIKQLSHERKNELFDVFNLCIKTIESILD